MLNNDLELGLHSLVDERAEREPGDEPELGKLEPRARELEAREVETGRERACGRELREQGNLLELEEAVDAEDVVAEEALQHREVEVVAELQVGEGLEVEAVDGLEVGEVQVGEAEVVEGVEGEGGALGHGGRGGRGSEDGRGGEAEDRGDGGELHGDDGRAG